MNRHLRGCGLAAKTAATLGGAALQGWMANSNFDTTFALAKPVTVRLVGLNLAQNGQAPELLPR
jgi:hypothetical protein